MAYITFQIFMIEEEAIEATLQTWQGLENEQIVQIAE